MKDLPLTDQETLDTITHLTQALGRTPTYREIGRAMGLRSTDSVHKRILRLRIHGVLRQEPGRIAFDNRP